MTEEPTAAPDPEVDNPVTYGDRVAAGAAVLDEEKPGWWTEARIDLAALDMNHSELCVAGQVFGDYYDRPHQLGEAESYGLVPAWSENETKAYAGLREAWVELITARRNAAVPS